MSLTDNLTRVIRNPRAAAAFLRHARSTSSQYGEDQVFRQLLRPGARGTFVDVGAHHPVAGSNTFNLYFRGWRGLTIDPNPELAAAYRHYRPRDTHLVRGVAGTPAVLNYRRYRESVRNSFSDEIAAGLAAMGIHPVAVVPVECVPLSALIGAHLADVQIDLLNVDCEGFDLEVLQSLDLSRHRPTVILIEDYDRYDDMRFDTATSTIHAWLAEARYAQIAQIAFSSLYIARDWPDLFARSAAYDAARIQSDFLP